MLIEVKRLWVGPENAEYRATTTGVLLLDGKQTAFTLEPTALMVPPGTYAVSLQWSARFDRRTPHLNVPGRTFIEIHGLNRAEESEGCIGVAEKRISDYEIYESKPATDIIEQELAMAEANGEASTVTVS